MKKAFRSGSILIVLLVAALVASPAYAGEQGLEKAKQAQGKHTDALLAMEGVVGTAVGYNPAGEPAVKIFTRAQGVAGLPKELDGVPTEVVVTGEFVALKNHTVDPKARSPRPVPIGVSTGNWELFSINGVLYCTVGTIGSRLKKGDDVYALSNNHVYAHENAAPLGSLLLQPGRVDAGSGCPDNSGTDGIGTLSDFEPLKFNPGACDASLGAADPDCNVIDAAVGLSSTDNLGKATPSNGYGTPKSETASALIGQKVQKYGRTTSLTKAQVVGLNATVNVGYSSGTAKFVGQIVALGTKPFLKSGDSGSLMVTDPGRNPVGLLFASSVIGYAIANPINPVLSRFGATVDGE